MLDLEPEENWLRHRLRRLRTILRYAKGSSGNNRFARLV